MERKPGFYWVVEGHGFEWCVAEYTTSDMWRLPGNDGQYPDEWFSEIDERQIVRNEL